MHKMKASRTNQHKNMNSRTRSTTLIEIVKPPSDFRAYRVVILPNGITTMLISDAPDLEDDKSDSTDTDDSLLSEGEAAAALCIGVGSFSDIPEIPGFAHFMEHMVFMGSKKYPKENYWDEFLAENGGESNAWTDCERTCFFFVCNQQSFSKALDIFAQFFISPLFLKQSVDREIMAVDSEWQMLAINDRERMRNLISFELVERGHPMAKFMAGNVKSLKEDPAKNGVNVYEQLHSFYVKMYSAHYMTLVVHSMETLDTMEENIIKIFTKIPNNDLPRPKFIKPPFQENRLNKLFRVIPTSNIHKMEIVWALPPLMEHYRARALEFLGLLLGHEGEGSILSYLRKRHIALDINAGNDFTGFTHNSTWSAFTLSIKLTHSGPANYEEVLRTVFQYIHLLKKNLPAHVFEEQRHIQETRYIFNEQESIYSYVEELAENMHVFPFEHYLCGRTLFFEFNEQLIQDCIDFLRPQGMLVMLFSRDFMDGFSLSEEPWTHVKYNVEVTTCQIISSHKHLLERGWCIDFFPDPVAKYQYPRHRVAELVCPFNTQKPARYFIVSRLQPTAQDDIQNSYFQNDFDTEMITRLTHLEPNPELTMPKPNPYIATNFNLLKIMKPTKYPVVVVDEGGCRIWFKKDNEYNLPNAFIYLNLISSAITKLSRNVALCDIFLTMVLHKLTETLYNATMAGYEYSVEGTPEGIIVIIGGYSEKIKLVTQDALRAFLELEVSIESFTSVATHLKQVYFNELLKPLELARAVRFSILEVKNTSVLERYEQISIVTYEMLLSFIQEFYSSLFVEGFVTGNLKPEDAVEIGGLAMSLVATALPEEDFPQPRVMQLALGDHKCFMSAINKEDINSCVVQYFQQGLGTIYNSCLNDLLAVAMTEPLFRILRSEYQLGYSVSCQSVVTDGVLGFLIAVESQADKCSMKQIDEIMDTFLHHFIVILEETSAAKFADMVNTQAQIRAADDADLNDESHRYWQEILKHNYVFNRLNLEYAAMKKITKRALVDWCKALMSVKSRKLTLLVEGHCEGKPEPEAAPEEVQIKSIRCLLRDLKSKKMSLHLPRPPQLQSPPNDEECLIRLKNLGLNYITDIRAFKSSLKEYPYHIIKK